MAKLLEYIGIMCVCILSYGLFMVIDSNEFVFDDGVAVVHNTDVTNTSRSIFESIQQIIVHDFWGQNVSDPRSHKSYRPIVTFMYNLEFRHFPIKNLAATMKRINWMIHCAICCILYDLLCRILGDCDKKVAWLTVLLFAVHPIHTENLCSVVGRADLMCTFFFLSAINQYLDLVQDHEANSKNELNYGRLIVLFGSAAACLFSKEIGIMVLPFCATYDAITNFRLPNIRRKEKSQRFSHLYQSCRNLIVRCAILSGMIIALVIIRSLLLGYEVPTFLADENPVAANPSLFTRTFTYFYLHTLHFWLLICPDWLCFDWSHNCVKLVEMWSDQRIFFAVTLFAFLIRAFFVGPRPVRIAVAFLVVPFIPATNILSVGFVVADRILYIPSIGYCLLISIGLHYISPKFPAVCRSLTIVVVTILMLRTTYRSIDWLNDYQLFRSGLQVCPDNAKIYYNIGQIAAERGINRLSIHYNLIANRLKPNSPATLNNLANAYRNMKQWDKAIKYHKEALDINQDYAIGWMNLGITYAQKGLYKDSLAAYKKSDEIQPNSEKNIFNMGNLYMYLGNFSMAEKMFRKAIDINPLSQRARVNLIRLLSEHGTREEALQACAGAEHHLLNNVAVMMTVADVFTKIDYNFERIEKIYLRIISIEPRNYLVHAKLATLYKKENNIKKALKYYKKAIELNSEFKVTNQEYLNFLLELKQQNEFHFRGNNDKNEKIEMNSVKA